MNKIYAIMKGDNLLEISTDHAEAREVAYTCCAKVVGMVPVGAAVKALNDAQCDQARRTKKGDGS